MDFTLVKEGQKEPIADSGHSDFYLRSVHLDVELEAGNYIVYVRLDRTLDRNENNTTVDEWMLRKLSRIMTERAKSQSIASNFKSDDKDKFLPLSLDSLIQHDFDEYEQKKKAAEETTTSTSVEEKTENGIVTTTTTTTTTTKVETIVVNKTAAAANNTTVKLDHSSSPDVVVPDKPAPGVDVSVETDPSINGTITPTAPNIDTTTSTDSNGDHARENAQQQRGYNYGDSTDVKKEEEKGKVLIPHDDSNSIYVGLRVYTHKDVPAVVVGRLKATKEVVKPQAETTNIVTSKSR
jgi:co-chaperonin GroES (HSP10)